MNTEDEPNHPVRQQLVLNGEEMDAAGLCLALRQTSILQLTYLDVGHCGLIELPQVKFLHCRCCISCCSCCAENAADLKGQSRMFPVPCR